MNPTDRNGAVSSGVEGLVGTIVANSSRAERFVIERFRSEPYRPEWRAALVSLTGLAKVVLRHRRLVVAVWLVLLVVGAAGAGQVSKRLSFDFSLPGQPGYETAKQITRRVGKECRSRWCAGRVEKR